MKIIYYLFLLLASFSSQKSLIQPEIKIPDWIIGKWSNTGCSDINNIIKIEIDSAKIFIQENIFSKKKDIINDNSNRKISFINDKNYCGLFFISKTDTISYEFKLSSSLGEEVLLWKFCNINEKRGFFYNDVSLVLYKIE